MKAVIFQNSKDMQVFAAGIIFANLGDRRGPMQPHDLSAFCERWLDAWTGNRPKELIQFYATDAYYRDPGRPDGLQGGEPLFEYLTRLLKKNPGWVWKAREIIPTAKGCVLKWVATIPTNSTPVIVEGLDILELRDDKITRNEVYFDRSALLKP